MASLFETYARINRLADKIDAFYDEKTFDPQTTATVYDALDGEFPELSKLPRKTFDRELDKFYKEWSHTPAVDLNGMLAAGFVAAKLYEKHILSEVAA